LLGLPTSTFATTELGGTATFMVQLASAPTAAVTLGVSSSAPGEATVAPPSLTFTTATWNQAQLVTVTGVDDLTGDGDQPYTIITAPAVSADPRYSGLNPPDVAGTNTDNDFSCVQLKAGKLVPDSGFYLIDADGPGGNAAFEVYCDMDTDDGGWMLLTPAMISSKAAVGVTSVDMADADGGLFEANYVNNPGCGTTANSTALVLFQDTVPWTQLRYQAEFEGTSSCWNIFGNTGGHDVTTQGANIRPFEAGVDLISYEVRMGPDGGDHFEGLTSRCDNDPSNFFHSLNGSAQRSATVTLRRDTSVSGLAGISFAVSCSSFAPGTTSPTVITHSTRRCINSGAFVQRPLCERTRTWPMYEPRSGMMRGA
jgi:hypothetical protein